MTMLTVSRACITYPYKSKVIVTCCDSLYVILYTPTTAHSLDSFIFVFDRRGEKFTVWARTQH